MKKLLLLPLLPLVLLLLATGISISAAAPSLQDTLENYTGGLIVLQDDATNIRISKTVYLDLNGHHISGVTVTEGTLYCMDSQTDDFTVSDGVYGTLTNVTGNIEAIPTDTEYTNNRYLILTENSCISFHRIALDIRTVSLRPADAGIYYSSYFYGDEAVARNTQYFGVALSVTTQPSAENLDTDCICTVFQNLPANSGDQVTSTLLYGILKETNTIKKNRTNANLRIYGAPYLCANGTVVVGNAVSITLKELCERIDTKWSQLSTTQQNTFRGLYTTYTTVMQNWAVPNVRNTPAQQPATMTAQSYNGLNYWLYTPANPTENMPLLVYLHGGSGKGDDLELITGVDGFPKYIQDGLISCPAYIVFPQCPSNQKGWKTLGGKIEALISYTCNQYKLDTGRVSITGHSMGGTGTWTLALEKPELFYKFAPMSGSVTVNDNNIATLKNIPVWAFVGDADKIVAPDTSIAMIEALQNAGADAKLTVFEGADHFSVPGLGYLGSDVILWLIS